MILDGKAVRFTPCGESYGSWQVLYPDYQSLSKRVSNSMMDPIS
jgi:hypothetical protein